MKPYPFLSLNHFTIPSATILLLSNIYSTAIKDNDSNIAVSVRKVIAMLLHACERFSYLHYRVGIVKYLITNVKVFVNNLIR